VIAIRPSEKRLHPFWDILQVNVAVLVMIVAENSLAHSG
jgi:hypothetical protein